MDLPWVWLLGWTVLVGLDLVSVPQIMIARPLVAGTVAGWIAGDPAMGATVGAVLELFALDVVPVGAVRYPDYGPATVAALATAAGTPGILGLGVGVAVGLLVAWAGEGSIAVVRRRTSAHVRARRAALEAGDPGTIRRVHLAGLGRDAVRALLLGAAGLALAAAVRRWLILPLDATILAAMAVVGTGLGVAAAGALRLAGRTRGLGWFAVGIVGGVAWVMAS